MQPPPVVEPVKQKRRIPGDVLRRFVADVFVRSGVPDEDALEAADALCVADERGIQSHGVARLRAYREMLVLGRINPKPSLRIVRESATVALIDGDMGLGLVIAPRANRIAMAKAEAAGIGWASVRNSNHYGIAGYYAMQGLSRNLIGISMTNTPALVSPFGGRGRVLGTNPLAVAIPAHSEPPFVMDMATSAISFGVVENALRRREPLPPHAVLDPDGEMSRDPAALLGGGSLVPLGGDRDHSGHKGYCLTALIDILCGVLSGANWGPFIPSFPYNLNPPRPEVGLGTGHLFGALKISEFAEPEAFKRNLDEWIRWLRSTPTIPGGQEVQIPGDAEWRATLDSAAHGIPLEESAVGDLHQLAQELNLRFDC